jgi:hypothetical protein
MQSLVICSSAVDAPVAGKIRRYLEANCRSIAVDDAIVPSGNELLETLERALSADAVLLLLSPDTNPGVRPREEWEPVLFEQPRELDTALAFLLARPCRFPELLRRQRFFDLSGDWHTGIRKLRCWLLDQNPLKQERSDLLPPCSSRTDVSGELLLDLERRIVDQPGTLCDVRRDTALAFAHGYSRDFEGTFWLDCAGRSRAGVIGDTAHALGLKLTGPVAENSLALREFCSGPRCLFVFDRLTVENRELVTLQGRASVIFTADSAEPTSTLPLAETVEIFAHWRSDSARCLHHLRDAGQHLQILNHDWSVDIAAAVKSLAASMFGLLRQQDRLAEAYEVLEILSKWAWNDGDAADLRRWEWEKSWIRSAWGEVAPARLRLGATPEPAQSSFDF